MFVAINIVSGARVVSLDPVWVERVGELCALTNSGWLVCPGCAQTLRFRVGDFRRPHFAHRVLSECPLSRQSVRGDGREVDGDEGAWEYGGVGVWAVGVDKRKSQTSTHAKQKR